MKTFKHLRAAFLSTACAMTIATTAFAGNFNIPSGDLASALNAYTEQTGVALIVSGEAVRGVRTHGVSGALNSDEALSRILSGTGFIMQHRASGAITITRDQRSELPDIEIAQAATTSRGAVETVTVTSSKLGGVDVQTVPIAISAFSQEQLKTTQTTGGPDLVKQVPNLNFTKTNFTGYDIQIRGIGTQAVSATTDPAVAVAFNDIPFIRNHFFEQEFYDVSQVEVLRGPQGTLYGRNATAGVVNLLSAKPTDEFEAMASAEFGNYHQRRFEGMINVPIVDDRLDLRAAAEWTKRNGYSFDETTDQRIDGRDLWSSRITVGFKPSSDLQTYLVWEHFSEDDDRLRSGKQLCKTDPGPAEVDGILLSPGARANLSQGCLPVSLYSPEAYETPNGLSLLFVNLGEYGGILNPVLSDGGPYTGPGAGNGWSAGFDPYQSDVQSRNLRVIDSELTPHYQAKNDTLEFNATYQTTPELIMTSQTGFNADFLYSAEDFNRFNTRPGIFLDTPLSPGGVFCDPQLGCSSKIVGEDLSEEHAWQIYQEFRLDSSFSGPFNFNLGTNYLHYETEENYYVFYNLVSLETYNESNTGPSCQNLPHVLSNPLNQFFLLGCSYVDPNPISSVDNNGHNYFLNQNPYVLNSYAGFGELNYQVLNGLKLTGGVRFTDDLKHFVVIPTQLFLPGWGYPIAPPINQHWNALTGRFVVNWTPKLDFTDQTLVYASFSRGYKAGGANPPAPTPQLFFAEDLAKSHPPTFAPEYNNAFEVGTKNTLLDGAMTLNASAFYYDYKGYQIPEFVDRTAINFNYDANVRGAELETTWEPLPGLKFNFAGGWEDSKIASGMQAIDLMDRTAGHPGWLVVKPFISDTSNCILPVSIVEQQVAGGNFLQNAICLDAYSPSATASPIPGYTPGPPEVNGGAGFFKPLAGNQLPNSPPFTASFGAQFSYPVTTDWTGTLHGDFYWQDNSFARVFNDRPYDQLRGYTNINLALIFADQNGWEATFYAKNVFDTTAITGTFLNTDDVGLTTNVFLTDPRLIGIRVTKNW